MPHSWTAFLTQHDLQPFVAAMLERSPIAMFITDEAGACVYVNGPWCALAGIAHDDALVFGWERALHPDDRERVADAWYQGTESGGRIVLRPRFLHADGTVVAVEAVGEPVTIDGRLLGYVGTVVERHEPGASAPPAREEERRD